MEAIKRTAPVPIEIMPMAENNDGYYHMEDKRIALREGMSEVQTVSAAIHEVAHSLLHSKEMGKELQAHSRAKTKSLLIVFKRKFRQISNHSYSDNHYVS